MEIANQIFMDFSAISDFNFVIELYIPSGFNVHQLIVREYVICNITHRQNVMLTEILKLYIAKTVKH